MGGSPKQLLPFGKGTILEVIIQKLGTAGFGPLIVVTGGPHEDKVSVAAGLLGAVVAVNPAPEPGGMITSVRRGIEALESKVVYTAPDPETGKSSTNRIFPGFLLHPTDFPAIRTDTYEKIFCMIYRNPGKIVIPVVDQGNYDSAGAKTRTGSSEVMCSATEFAVFRRGHPTWFPWHLIEEIENPAETDLRSVAERHRKIVCELPVQDGGITADLNTIEEYNRHNRA